MAEEETNEIDFGGLAQTIQNILDGGNARRDHAHECAYYKGSLVTLREELQAAHVTRRCSGSLFPEFSTEKHVEAPAGGHYDGGDLEPIKVGRKLGWGYELTAAFKYMQRAGRKEGESRSEPLRKAAYLLNRLADHWEGKE